MYKFTYLLHYKYMFPIFWVTATPVAQRSGFKLFQSRLPWPGTVDAMDTEDYSSLSRFLPCVLHENNDGIHSHIDTDYRCRYMEIER